MDTNDMNNQHNSNSKLRKQCHGNRRDQRFRRKCRKQGMKPKTIEKLLNKRKQMQNKTQTNDILKLKPSNENSTDLNNVSKLKTMSSSKRKRDISLQHLAVNQKMIKSTSELSNNQPLRKQMKRKHNNSSSSSLKNNNHHINRKYGQPTYLKHISSKIFQILSKSLNYSLRKKCDQRFLYTRLDLFDQQYCLDIHKQLWQSYFDIGLQKRIWPDELYTMAKSKDFEICQQYLLNYIKDIDNDLDLCQKELSKQSQLCPITKLTMNVIDSCLKIFVSRQRKYLASRINKHLFHFKDIIREKELSKAISLHDDTMNQNMIINELITLREKQAEIWEQLLLLQMRILYKALPKNFDDLENFIAPSIYSPVIQNAIAIEFKNKRYKIIQEAKREWLNITLNAYETKIQEYEHQYQCELSRFKSCISRIMTSNGESFFKDIEEYLSIRTNKLKRDIYTKVLPIRRTLLKNRQRSISMKNKIGVSPEPYLDLLSNPFDKRQWSYLSLGPSCIRLNQSAIRSHRQQEVEIKKEHTDIYNKIASYLIQNHNIPREASILKQYSKQLLDYINHCYFAPLSYKDRLQLVEQANITTSIRQKIKKLNLIIRITDKSHNFYIGSAKEYEKKVQQFFDDTNAFVELSENPYNEVQTKVIQLLNQLQEKKLILAKHYKQMFPDRKKTELAHLYFNPKTHKDGIPIRPIENTIRAPTTTISKFLDKLIRPIFDEKCRTTIIIDGVSLIKELNTYMNKGLFKPTTLLCTFDIHNLYTMLPQDEALNVLIEFLYVHGYKKVQGIPLDAIRKLASIVLKENVFVYGDKIYKQVLGGAMGSSFTLTLANIFMWKWQKELVRQQDITGEFYGRYIDDILMTWNRSENELKYLLHEANQWHPNIKLEYKIGQTLPFLDVLLTNDNGILSTSVYHKPATEPYIAPFISDHPGHVFSNIIATGLTRAIKHSSTLQHFNKEQRYIRLKLLYNG